MSRLASAMVGALTGTRRPSDDRIPVAVTDEYVALPGLNIAESLYVVEARIRASAYLPEDHASSVVDEVRRRLIRDVQELLFGEFRAHVVHIRMAIDNRRWQDALDRLDEMQRAMFAQEG